MSKVKYQLWVQGEDNVWRVVDFFHDVEDAIKAYDEMKEKAEEAGDSASYQYELVQVVSAGSGY